MKKSAAFSFGHGFLCILTALLGLALAAKAGEIGGHDLSQGGFGRSAPVIAALENYRHDQGSYPAREQELTPRYLPADLRYGVYRHLPDGSFALVFGYTRGTLPGLTVWTYYSTGRKWVHSGYY